jgi:hypothetical protein
MSKLYFLPLRPAHDSAGVTVPGSQHWFTLAGTNTPSAPFTDATLTIPLENPIIANGVGYLPPVYMNEAISYRVRVYDRDAEVGVDAPLEEYDPYVPAIALLTYLGDSGFDGLFVNASTLIVPLGTDAISTVGYATLGIGGANYLYDAAVDATYVAANPRSSFMSANGRGFRLDLEQGIIPQMLGAHADGIIDCRAIIAATDALGPFELPLGDYLIGSSITISSEVNFLPSSRLIIPTGVTVTFSSEISAGIEQIFVCTGTGAVVFNRTKTAFGYLEWWGAKADQSGYCDAAWTAAHLALSRVHGQPGNYLFLTTPKIPGPHMGFIGSGRKYTSTTNHATRLLVDGTQNCIQIGPDTFAGSFNAMPQDIEARDFFVGRTAAPAISSGCIGVRNQFTLRAVIERVISENSMIEFSFYGTVATKCIDCDAARALAGTGAGTDSWRGFHADGSASIGAAGGNASLYITRPAYSCNLAALQTGDSAGVSITGNFSDIFIDQPEGVSCRDDITIVGNGSTGADFGNADCRIRASTSDQFNRYGISVSNVGATGIVQIEMPYLGPASGATASIFQSNNLGAVTILGGEIDHYAAPNAQALSASGCKGLQLLGTAINEVGNATPAITLANVTNSRINPLIKNAAATGQIAIQLTGACYANSLTPIVMGKASAFTKGIDVAGIAVTFTAALVGATSATLTANWTKATGAWTVLFSDGTTKAVTFTNGATTATWTGAVTATANATYLDDQRNEYNLTGIDSACIASGSGNKLVRQSVQIVATGLTGTSLVSGVVT